MVFLLWTFLNTKTNVHSDIAYVPNIEILTDVSAIVLKRTVLDDVEVENLRRNTEDPNKEASDITPGKYHSVIINEVLVGVKEVKGKTK